MKPVWWWWRVLRFCDGIHGAEWIVVGLPVVVLGCVAAVEIVVRRRRDGH